MNRNPATKQRSEWVQFDTTLTLDVKTLWFDRKVGDGLLVAAVAEEPHGWHMSISFRDHRGKLTRYPRWDEIAHARDVLLPDDVGFVMHLPPSGEYVALHDTTFHLHQHPEPRLSPARNGDHRRDSALTGKLTSGRDRSASRNPYRR